MIDAAKSDDILDTSVVDQLTDPDTDLLDLLTTEADCTAILNNIATNEQFEQLINNVVVDDDAAAALLTAVDDHNDIHVVDIQTSNGVPASSPVATVAIKPFKCYQCERTYKTKKILKKHLLAHETAKTFACDVCTKTFRYRYEVDVHKRTHNKPTLQCDICARMFVHKSHLTVHRRKHLGDYVAFCRDCHIGFVTQSAYKAHRNVRHDDVDANSRRLVCDVCGARLSTASALREHKFTHDANYGIERTHVCDICGKSYLTARNLRSHLKSHHSAGHQFRQYVCRICGKSVSNRVVLETHMKMHTGVKDFKCGVCGKDFASKEYLMVHQRIHSGTKPYGCEYCGKRFTQKTSLTVHLRCHSGHKPYKCECGKEFTTKSHLMSHYKTHDIGGVDIEYISHPINLFTPTSRSEEIRFSTVCTMVENTPTQQH